MVRISWLWNGTSQRSKKRKSKFKTIPNTIGFMNGLGTWSVKFEARNN